MCFSCCLLFSKNSLKTGNFVAYKWNNGAKTFRITTLSIRTLSIMFKLCTQHNIDLLQCCYAGFHFAECCYAGTVMLNVTMLVPLCWMLLCWMPLCCMLLCHGHYDKCCAEGCNAWCHYVACCYAGCHYTECIKGAIVLNVVPLSVIILNVVMLGVIKISVMAAKKRL